MKKERREFPVSPNVKLGTISYILFAIFIVVYGYWVDKSWMSIMGFIGVTLFTFLYFQYTRLRIVLENGKFMHYFGDKVTGTYDLKDIKAVQVDDGSDSWLSRFFRFRLFIKRDVVEFKGRAFQIGIYHPRKELLRDLIMNTKLQKQVTPQVKEYLNIKD
ncbi:hypothetical protein [Rubeoparvulum massiliense]|uniref:hypothetical protein n=1 Tax=Rubeoparvulum massiliense TaxID=1631346 RepID=UPI00065DF34B|nr:hypothetical protein [Rubeoparvulum massiliense]